jgi:hypothetical protein
MSNSNAEKNTLRRYIRNERARRSAARSLGL